MHYYIMDEGVKELLKQSQQLIDFAGQDLLQFKDYSFVVFPAAKAYEGFLKKKFLDMGFIGSDDYGGKHFRIGKALNPSLEEKYRTESVYDKICDYCTGRELADQLWETWKNCRNTLFHWFPNEKNAISYEESKARVAEILAAMDAANLGCKIK